MSELADSEALFREIEELTLLGAEGDYWDYKTQWHDNRAKLLHDIICFANNQVDRDCYIIVGVKDKTGEILGVPEDSRKTQQMVIDFLRGVRFAGGYRPKIFVKTMSSGKKEVDILIIKNTEHTPYYLEKQYDDGKVTVRAGFIYTRVGDTNTPITETADFHQTQLLWRKRFGLLNSPITQAKKLLQESTEWEKCITPLHTKSEVYYHMLHPEFTIRITDIGWEDDEQAERKLAHMDFYLFTSPDSDGNKDYTTDVNISVMYYGTPLVEFPLLYICGSEMRIISFDHVFFRRHAFDDQQKHAVCMVGGTWDYLLNNFLQEHYNEKATLDYLYIREVALFFSDEQEQTDFKQMVESHWGEFQRRRDEVEVPGSIHRADNEKQLITERYKTGRALVDWLEEWRGCTSRGRRQN